MINHLKVLFNKKHYVPHVTSSHILILVHNIEVGNNNNVYLFTHAPLVLEGQLP
jgi:hypothetical protein